MYSSQAESSYTIITGRDGTVAGRSDLPLWESSQALGILSVTAHSIPNPKTVNYRSSTSSTLLHLGSMETYIARSEAVAQASIGTTPTPAHLAGNAVPSAHKLPVLRFKGMKTTSEPAVNAGTLSPAWHRSLRHSSCRTNERRPPIYAPVPHMAKMCPE
jgi:hypothetical protein